MAPNPTTFKMTEIPNSEIQTILDEIENEGKFEITAKQQNPNDQTWTLTVHRKKA
jgi:hypothetical protein